MRFWTTVIRDLAERRGPAVWAVAVFSGGTVLGALAAGSLGDTYRTALATAVDGLFGLLASGNRPVSPATALLYKLSTSGQLLGLFWLLGITVIGVLAIWLLIFLRGFASGFAASFLAAELGWRGTAYAAAALLPHSLLEIPALALAGASAVHLARQVLIGRARRSPHAFYRELAAYSRWLILAAGLMLMAAVVESYVTPVLMRAVAAW